VVFVTVVWRVSAQGSPIVRLDRRSSLHFAQSHEAICPLLCVFVPSCENYSAAFHTASSETENDPIVFSSR
jgi:hypothetical protein